MAIDLKALESAAIEAAKAHRDSAKAHRDAKNAAFKAYLANKPQTEVAALQKIADEKFRVDSTCAKNHRNSDKAILIAKSAAYDALSK